MALKTTLAAGFAALTLLLMPPSAAEAKTKVKIGVAIGGLGHPCWGYHGYRCGWRHKPHYLYYKPRHRPGFYYYDDYGYDDYRRVRSKMSCGAARHLVDVSGFNSVKTRECQGKVYTFKARKKGHNYIVKVNAVARRIIGASRL